MPTDPLDARRLPIVPVEPRPEFAEALLRRLQQVGQSERRATPTVRYFVNDIDAEVARLREAGVSFRNDVVSGPGGRQILLEDPSGNPIELFQPARRG